MPAEPNLQTLAQAFTNVGTVSGYRQSLQGAAENLRKAGEQHIEDTRRAVQKLRGVRGYIKGRRATAEAKRFQTWVTQQAAALEAEAKRRQAEERQHQQSAEALLGALVKRQGELEAQVAELVGLREQVEKAAGTVIEPKPLWQRALDRVTLGE